MAYILWHRSNGVVIRSVRLASNTQSLVNLLEIDRRHRHQSATERLQSCDATTTDYQWWQNRVSTLSSLPTYVEHWGAYDVYELQPDTMETQARKIRAPELRQIVTETSPSIVDEVHGHGEPENFEDFGSITQ